MAVCPNCNTVNEDGAGFCANCGTPMEQQPVQQENPFEGMSSNEIISDVMSGVIEQAEPVQEAPEAPEKKKGGKKWLLFGGIGAAVIAVAVGAFFLINGAKDKKVEQVFYMKDGSLFYRDLDGKESLELAGKVNKNKDQDNTPRVVVNADQSRVFYAEKIEGVRDEADEYGYGTYYKYDLCYVDLNKKKAEPTKVASDVTWFEINAEGTKVVYQTAESTLYISDLKEEEKIEKNVSGFYANKELTRIGYQKEDKLYLWEKGESEKIASSVSNLYHVDDDVTYVVYAKEEKLYVQELGKDAVEVAENCYNVYSGDGKAFYYTTTGEGGSSIMDYVEDDMKDADAKMTEPVYPEYPTYPDYPSRPYSWDYETDEEYQAATEQYEKDMEAYEAEKKRLEEEYNAAVEKYNKDLETYWSKESRDNMREDLKTYEFSSSVYSLYYFDGKASTLLTDSMANSWYEDRAYDADAMIISVTSMEGFEKVKLSEVEYVWDIEEQVRQAMEGAISYALISGKTLTKLDLKDAENIVLTNDGSAIWYIADVKAPEVEEGEEADAVVETAVPVGNLYKMAVKDGKPGKAEKYDEKVYANDISTGANDEVAYYKDVEMEQEEYYSYGVGTLYINKKEVVKDISCGYCSYSEDMKAWVIMTDRDEKNNTHTVSLYENGKLTEVAEDIVDAAMTPGGDLVYLTDWDSKDECGTLFSYNNGKPVEIDDEVQAILQPQFMEK